MANIPGATNVLPGVFTDVITQSRGVSIPGGARLAAMIGQGSTDDTIVSQAVGGGKDGLNSTYSSSSGADGRHFQLTNFPLISNRTTLFQSVVSFGITKNPPVHISIVSFLLPTMICSLSTFIKFTGFFISYKF